MDKRFLIEKDFIRNLFKVNNKKLRQFETRSNNVLDQKLLTLGKSYASLCSLYCYILFDKVFSTCLGGIV